jgi:hypothetical protein
MKKIIGTYIILVAISGITFILGFLWLIYNVGDSMAGLKPLLSYVFGVNIYVFATLSAVGLIISIITKYINRKK